MGNTVAPSSEEMASSVEELQAYFAQHAIQERLNDMLNQLVQVRPAAPYSWLAARMRGTGPNPTPADTCPLLSKDIGAEELGLCLANKWNFCQAFSSVATLEGSSDEANVSQPAPPAGTGGVNLSIEPGGNSSVLLVIRKK